MPRGLGSTQLRVIASIHECGQWAWPDLLLPHGYTAAVNVGRWHTLEMCGLLNDKSSLSSKSSFQRAVRSLRDRGLIDTAHTFPYGYGKGSESSDYNAALFANDLGISPEEVTFVAGSVAPRLRPGPELWFRLSDDYLRAIRVDYEPSVWRPTVRKFIQHFASVYSENTANEATYHAMLGWFFAGWFIPTVEIPKRLLLYPEQIELPFIKLVRVANSPWPPSMALPRYW